MPKGLSYKRTMRKKHIKRKSKIVKETWFHGEDMLADEHFVGALSKGKVHCSCSMCSSKTADYGYKHHELCDYIDQYQQLNECGFSVPNHYKGIILGK